jgi:1-aminocyclopropane-1-carboxylate deaminase
MGQLLNFPTAGIIRGENADNPTLQDCNRWGMKLHFISRTIYKEIRDCRDDYFLSKKFPDFAFVPEGGDNEDGVKGASDIVRHIIRNDYDVCCVSVGTGTTLKGLLRCGKPFTKRFLGFAPMKGGSYLQKNFNHYENVKIIDEYHLGGFGKINEFLSAFMQTFERKVGFSLDRVYTAKMMYGMIDYIQNKRILPHDKILMIHTGGVQGNRGG